jgi:hypothetical protein
MGTAVKEQNKQSTGHLARRARGPAYTSTYPRLLTHLIVKELTLHVAKDQT